MSPLRQGPQKALCVVLGSAVSSVFINYNYQSCPVSTLLSSLSATGDTVTPWTNPSCDGDGRPVVLNSPEAEFLSVPVFAHTAMTAVMDHLVLGDYVEHQYGALHSVQVGYHSSYTAVFMPVSIRLSGYFCMSPISFMIQHMWFGLSGLVMANNVSWIYIFHLGSIHWF